MASQRRLAAHPAKAARDPENLSGGSPTGIIDAHDFRNEIMARRDALKSRSASAPAGTTDAQLAVLQDISAKLDQLLAIAREQRPKP